jgi:hypothetical protein
MVDKILKLSNPRNSFAFNNVCLRDVYFSYPVLAHKFLFVTEVVLSYCCREHRDVSVSLLNREVHSFIHLFIHSSIHPSINGSTALLLGPGLFFSFVIF